MSNEKTLNQQRVLIASSTEVLTLFSLTAHLLDEYVFSGAQTHLGAAQTQFGSVLCMFLC